MAVVFTKRDGFINSMGKEILKSARVWNSPAENRIRSQKRQIDVAMPMLLAE
jgi:hypothetical protein